MNKEIALQTIQALTLSVMILFGSSFAEAEELSSPLTHNEPKLNLSDQPLNDLLFSSRIEAIFRRSYRGPIREDSSDQSKLYFNALYLNLEGALNHSLDFLIEFQPYVSDLYLLGGFVSVAGPLEGIASGGEEATARARTISEIVHDRIKILDDASDYPSAERVELDYSFDDFTGLRIGRVRNPWGLWDDYSLFRNLSAGKTDPVTLGVQLRRTDYGAIQYGQIAKSLSYELGILTGENSADSIESNTAKDAVGRLNYNFSKNDFGINYYRHNIGSGKGPIHAGGAYWRLGLSYSLTLLGEYMYMYNSELDALTRSCYLQLNYNLGHYVDGLRWNTFFESYNSDLLKVDFDEELDYRFKGTILRSSTGFLYALTRNIDVGAQIVVGKDEEGDDTLEAAIKLDLQF